MDIEEQEGIVSGSQQSPAGQDGGHRLSVERIFDAPPEAISDAFEQAVTELRRDPG